MLTKYSVPAVIAMMVNAIYNIVDRIFIGQFAGEGALASLTIVFPVMMIIFAFANLIGAGGAALMSIKLGEKDPNATKHVFGNMISMGLIVSVIIGVIVFINLESVLNIFGATPDILDDGISYMQIILCGFMFQMISLILNSALRAEGQPMLAMSSMLVSAVTNIVLDYVFIAILHMGVEGAALATVIGQLVGLLILLSFYIRGKSNLKVKLKDFILDFKVCAKIVTIGFATFITTLSASIATGLMNKYLGDYGSTAAITSMGAINSLYTLFIMPVMGIQQGMQPIVGYNCGAKKIDRTYKTLKLSIIVGVIFSTVVCVLLEVFPQTFISMFLDPTSATMDVAITGLRIYMVMLPVLCISFFGTSFFQSTAKGTHAFILGILRQVVLLIPAIIILSNIFGLTGVWMAIPISDGLAVLVTAIVLISNYKKNRGLSNQRISFARLINAKSRG